MDDLLTDDLPIENGDVPYLLCMFTGELPEGISVDLHLEFINFEARLHLRDSHG